MREVLCLRLAAGRRGRRGQGRRQPQHTPAREARLGALPSAGSTVARLPAVGACQSRRHEACVTAGHVRCCS